MALIFTKLQDTDLPFVKEIYDYYTLNTTVVYFINPVSIEELKTFIPVGDPVYHSYLVCTEEGEKCGFCYFGRYRSRAAYDITVEVTLYLKPEYTGRGYGKEILTRLEADIHEGGFKNIMALVSADNEVSARLFEKYDYECCGHLREVGEKFGQRVGLKVFQKLL